MQSFRGAGGITAGLLGKRSVVSQFRAKADRAEPTGLYRTARLCKVRSSRELRGARSPRNSCTSNDQVQQRGRLGEMSCHETPSCA